MHAVRHCACVPVFVPVCVPVCVYACVCVHVRVCWEGVCVCVVGTVCGMGGRSGTTNGWRGMRQRQQQQQLGVERLLMVGGMRVCYIVRVCFGDLGVLY